MELESKENIIDIAIKERTIELVTTILNNDSTLENRYVKFPLVIDCFIENNSKYITSELDFRKISSSIFDNEVNNSIVKWENVSIKYEEKNNKISGYRINFNYSTYIEEDDFNLEYTLLLIFELFENDYLLTKIYCAG